MNKIIPPITQQTTGPAVGNLQEALVFLRFKIAESERANPQFGISTRKAVSTFQTRHNLPPTGEVDIQTADLINRLLAEAGVLDGGPTKPPDQLFTVRGHVISHERRGLADLRVVAVDKNVGSDALLGEATTADRGAYKITYPLSKVRPGKLKPDVQVQVFDGKKALLAVSAVRYNAGSEENGLDISVPAEKLPRPAEYRLLIGDLGLHLGTQEISQIKRRLSELKEDSQQQDITYLANKTGWDARMVAMSALASQFGERSGIEPEFYYALFRTGLPANEAVLSRLSPKIVEQVWKRAADQKIIPGELKGKISESLERFTVQSGGSLLALPAQIGVSSFKDLLAGSIQDSATQERVASLYYKQRENLEGFWEELRQVVGPEAADRLQLDGKLGFLTVNNAPLIKRLHQRNRNLRTPLDLVRNGFYRSDAWEELLGEDGIIPNEIPGETPKKRKANYAAFLADQLRLSYPTAVVAEMVRADTIPLRAEQKVKTAVTQFLMKHQGTFELGIHPVEHYLLKNDIAIDSAALAQLKTLQRVYQISPSDETMAKLLAHRIDSAQAVVRYDEQVFVGTFKEELGGESVARLVYAKAQQVHHTVLNIYTTYLLEKSSPALYAFQSLPGMNGSASMNVAAADGDEAGVIAMPTLERIFGEMDYCACDHCRSWLSPAAYLVDLLLFLNREPDEWTSFLRSWRAGHDEAPYPFLNQEKWTTFQEEWEARNPGQVLPNTEIVPLEVLLGRRPDIQHLQLSCENTNTVLPYIDLVNEILEHFVVHGSLEAFTGHNMKEGISTQELLANPQFVNDMAYKNLRDIEEGCFPPPLPFHRPLEELRRYMEQFETPLHEVMERFRKTDLLERTGRPADPEYGWRDILMERLQLSRPEHAILTDSGTPLKTLYGESSADGGESDLINRLSNAKTLSRKLGLTYEELIEITRTQFINPHSRLIPKLEKLGLTFKTIQDLREGRLIEKDLERLIEIGDLDVAQYGGRPDQSDEKNLRKIAGWLRDNFNQIMGLIILTDPTGREDICSFDHVELRYAWPDFSSNRLESIEFLKLLRFVRLWRKLGWSIDQTDRVLTALYPAARIPAPGDDAVTARGKLDAGFRTFLPRLAHLKVIMEKLQLTPKRDLGPLLACWSAIDTHGYDALYRKMFLNRTILALDPIFNEDGYGGYLAEKSEFQTGAMEAPRLLKHAEALRAAFNLTQEELDLLLNDLHFDRNTLLTLENLSLVFRNGYLARKLRLSIRELLELKALSGLNPFLPLDLEEPSVPTRPHGAARPEAIRFIELAQRIKASPLKISQLVYLLRHEDLTGKASPSGESVLSLVRTLRNDLLRIDRENGVQEDPSGEIAKAKMALAYGVEAADVFFGLLTRTSLFTTDYHQNDRSLSEDIRRITDRIAYDHFQKKLSYRGVMTAAEKTALEAVSGVTETFRQAVQVLFDAGRKMFSAFFDRYPELREPYENFPDFRTVRNTSALLEALLPNLRTTLKRQQVRQTISTQLDAAPPLVTLLLDSSPLLHVVGRPDQPASENFLALELQGISADIYFTDDLSRAPDISEVTVNLIDYFEGGTALPSSPTDTEGTINGIWQGFLEAPDNGFYNFYVEADPDARIELVLGGEQVELIVTDGVPQNRNAIELEAGRLYALKLTARRIKKRLILKWERAGMGRSPIPAEYLYPARPVERFVTIYLRILKGLALAEALNLSAKELEHFAAHDDYLIDGKGWLNALPSERSLDENFSESLLAAVMALLQYCSLKEALKVRDDRLVELLKDPSALGDDGIPLIGRVTGWPQMDLITLLDRFGMSLASLSHLDHFVRLHEAFAILKKLGIGARSLLAVSSNEPDAEALRLLQGALRARHDQNSWLTMIQAINDALRSRQRDALVAYVLQRLQQSGNTAHIDTTDKLFEYFLIDVEMDPCMKTSRIKQALSSIQLFIQRCLLNLEPQVASASIKAKQWEWMKRYRVWEANRKIFLWPENWLEPELRDNKSPCFKAFESELLQSDITDDAAATALVHYLEKLDELAKLEVCGMYCAENEIYNDADDVVHVIARTAGARRSYYYRRQEGGISWTPWEKIDLNIEDNPVLPVVWGGRLFLFWVSVLQQGTGTSGSSSSAIVSAEAIGSQLFFPPLPIFVDLEQPLDLTSVTRSALRGVAGEPRITATAALYWSEYYSGKWQPVRTSDVNQPVVLGDFPPNGGGAFNRSRLTLHSSEGSAGELLIHVKYPDKPGSIFTLYNTHSLPVAGPDRAREQVLPNRTIRVGNAPFAISYAEIANERWGLGILFERKILNKGALYEVIEPKHRLREIFKAPFFFQDRQHLFFVRTEVSRITVAGSLDIGVNIPKRDFLDAPPVLIETEFPIPEVEPFKRELIMPGLDSPIPVAFLLEQSRYIHQAVGAPGSIQFGDRLIGPSGSMQLGADRIRG